MKWYLLAQDKGETVMFNCAIYDRMETAWAQAEVCRASGDYDNIYVLPGVDPSEPEEP